MTLPRRRFGERALDLIFAALSAATLVAAAWLSPRGGAVLTPAGEDLGVLCPSRAWLGLDCPFCGLTRSFVALAHGQLGEAWHHHPAGPLLFAAMAVFVAAALAAWLRGTRPLTGRIGLGRAVEAMTLGALALGLGRSLALS